MYAYDSQTNGCCEEDGEHILRELLLFSSLHADNNNKCVQSA